MTPLNLLWLKLTTGFQTAGGWIAKTATIGNFVVLFTAGVVVLTMQELMRDAFTIEPIEVPKALSDDGYTPSVAGHRLRDALNTYADETTSLGNDGTNLNSTEGLIAAEDASLHSNLELNIAARDELPDVVVPQIGLSLGAIVSSIRSVLNKRGHVISGELTLRDSKYALRVRIDGRQVFRSEYESENPDDLLTKAAPAVMDSIRPSVNAMARYRIRNEDGLLKADEIIADHDKSDINVQGAYILKGNHALKQNNFGEAEEMFSKAASLNLNGEQRYIQLGVLLLRQAKPAQAIEKFQRVIAISPKSAKAYNNIGIALTAMATQDNSQPDMAMLDDAIVQYRQAIAAEPGYPLPYNNLGLALLRLDRINDAIHNYRLAILVAPKYLFAHWNLAYALQRQKSFDEALAEYRVAIDCTQDKVQLATLYTSLGDTLWQRAGENGNLEEAIAQYRRAIEIDPEYSWAHNNLGLIRRGQGKISDAIAEFRIATQLDKSESIKDNLEEALRQSEAGAEAGALVR